MLSENARIFLYTYKHGRESGDFVCQPRRLQQEWLVCVHTKNYDKNARNQVTLFGEDSSFVMQVMSFKQKWFFRAFKFSPEIA